jgi:hypothetical protein
MSDVKIIIQAVDKASKEIQKVSQELGHVKGGADKAAGTSGGGGLAGLSGALRTAMAVAGSATAAFVALKTAFDWGREGAQLDYAAGKFDRLAESIGTTSDALLRDLKDATRGTMSDMELMASTGDLMALGLAKSHDEAVRLSRVGGALGMNMNQLVLTLTNQTTMRFDALGVSVDGFQEKVNQLKAAGMSANEAFAEAFLQQAEGQLEKIGSRADTDAGKFARLDAAVKNLGDGFKRKLAPAMADVAEWMTNLLTLTDRLKAELAENEDAAFDTAASYEEYKQRMIEAAKAAGYWVDEHGQLRLGQLQVMDANYLMAESVYAAIKAVESNPEAYVDMAERVRGIGDAAGDTAGMMETTFKSAVENLTLAFKPLTAEILYNQLAANMDKDAALALAVEMGLLDGKAYNLLTAMDELTKKYDINGSGAIEAAEQTAEYWAEVTKLRNAIDGLQSKTVYVGVEVNWNSLGSDGLSEAYNTNGRGGAQEGFASGGSFVIPPGHPNDSYYLGMGKWAQSGETVTVTPAGEKPKGGDTIINVYATINGAQDVYALGYQLADMQKQQGR